MIYDRLPSTPLMQHLAYAARVFCVDEVQPLTGPFFGDGPDYEKSLPMPGVLEDFGVVLASHYRMRMPRLAVVHRDLDLKPHTDARAVPFESTNLAVFFRRNVSGGELIVEPDTIAEQTVRAEDEHVLVFEGRDLTHTVRPFVVRPGGYRITLTYYCPKE